MSYEEQQDYYYYYTREEQDKIQRDAELAVSADPYPFLEEGQSRRDLF